MQHNGYMLREWVFGWIPHVKTTLRVLNIVDAAIRNAHCDSESHRQEMGQVESNDM